MALNRIADGEVPPKLEADQDGVFSPHLNQREKAKKQLKVTFNYAENVEI